MHPHNTDLTKFTLLVKHIIYDDARMKAFLHMLGSPEGAIVAVHTVLGAIQQAKPIPPAIIHQLAFNAYTLLVDAAQRITGQKASPAIMTHVIKAILHSTNAMLTAGPVSSGQTRQRPTYAAMPATTATTGPGIRRRAGGRPVYYPTTGAATGPTPR